MKIVLLGPHGAGKSTQAHLLSAALHIPYISTGGMLRALASQAGEHGIYVRDRLEKGDYFTDQEMIPLVEQRLEMADTVHGFILEGFPRTLAQAKALKLPIDMALHLQLSIEEGTKRLLARHRADDTPEIIHHRLAQYQAEEAMVLDFYKQKHLLREIDANRSIEVVQADLLAAVR